MDANERFHQHEEILQGLATMLTAQHEMNQEQREINQRLILAIEHIGTTLVTVNK